MVGPIILTHAYVRASKESKLGEGNWIRVSDMNLDRIEFDLCYIADNMYSVWSKGREIFRFTYGSERVCDTGVVHVFPLICQAFLAGKDHVDYGTRVVEDAEVCDVVRDAENVGAQIKR